MKPFLTPVITILLLCGCATTPAPRPMKLVVLGPPNIPVAATYTVDGLTTTHSAVMPAAFDFRGRSAAEWKVQRLAGNEEFRVEFYVGDLRRTSTISAGHSAIRGAILYENNRERYWAQAVE